MENRYEKRHISERYKLESGAPCIKNKCALCCIETRMPLSHRDIKRILKMGYRLKDFAIKTGEGWHLKNRYRKCVFLRGTVCEIYPYRPDGCRLYPLIYDENLQRYVVDHLCPHCHEFEVTKSDREKLKELLKRLDKEIETSIINSLFKHR